MGFDKVVDSAKLENAITATADAIRAKTGSAEKIPWDAESGLAGAVESIPQGGGIPADNVKFGNTPIDPDVMYAVGYNWFAEVVRKLQPMVGTTQDMSPADILDGLGMALYIPQGRASSAYSENYSASAVGVLPNVPLGIATGVYTENYIASAVGTLMEE